MSEPTDAALWQRACAGEAEAFGTLFERQRSHGLQLLLSPRRDWSQAEEPTAVVFLEAWRRRHEIRLERADAVPFLLGVATNVVRNSRRSQRRHPAALARLPR